MPAGCLRQNGAYSSFRCKTYVSFYSQANDWFKEKLLEQITNYEGPQDQDEISKGWNKLFIKVSKYKTLMWHNIPYSLHLDGSKECPGVQSAPSSIDSKILSWEILDKFDKCWN